MEKLKNIVNIIGYDIKRFFLNEMSKVGITYRNFVENFREVLFENLYNFAPILILMTISLYQGKNQITAKDYLFILVILIALNIEKRYKIYIFYKDLAENNNDMVAKIKKEKYRNSIFLILLLIITSIFLGLSSINEISKFDLNYYNIIVALYILFNFCNIKGDIKNSLNISKEEIEFLNLSIIDKLNKKIDILKKQSDITDESKREELEILSKILDNEIKAETAKKNDASQKKEKILNNIEKI